MALEKEVVVIGAGISGLTVAHALTLAGREVTLIERSAHVGGRMHSQRHDGFLLEHGPNTMIAPAAAAESLIAVAGLAGERIARGEEVRRRYLVRNGKIHALPIDPMGFFLSSFFTLRGRLRLMAEPLIPAQHADESIASFVHRRFGRELLDYVFDPLVGGLYVGDPEQLSVAAVFPQLKALERNYGSIVRGMIARHRGDRAFDPRRRTLFSLRDGLGSLPQALAHALAGRVMTRTRVDAIAPRPGGGFRLRIADDVQQTTLDARQVVVALPAYAAARVLAPLDEATATQLAQIKHPPLAVVWLGYRREAISHPLDGLGALMPKLEQRGVLGMLFSSTLFEGRAPNGQALLTVYVGGARQPELALLPREELLRLVEREVRELLGVSGKPLMRHVHYWQRSLPQPDLDHAQRIDAMRALEGQWPGLYLAGNYLNGVSTTACIESAMNLAGRMTTQGHPASAMPIATHHSVRPSRNDGMSEHTT